MTVNHLYPTTRPSLDLNFARQKRLDPRVTFTRGSTATYVGDDGLIKTAASNEARFDHDPATGESLGLLVEESRTNLFWYSAEFDNARWTKTATTVTANTTTAPDGTTTADRLEIQSGSGFTYDANVSVSGTYTVSMWVKAVTPGTDDKFRLVISGTNLTADLTATNEWVRYSYTATASTSNNAHGIARSATGASDVYVWGAQLEAGSFPTSYIPTSGSTVTRSADVASMTGTNFSSWYNQSEGTLLQSFVPKGSNVTYAGRLSLNSTNYTGSYINPKTRIVHMYRTPAAENALLKTGTYVNTAVKLGMSYDTAGFSGCYNGTAVQTDSSINGTQSTLTQLLVGIGTQHISRLTYYPTRLTDSQLQELTR